MAITINNTPSTYPSMHESLWFVVTSTNIAQPNFKYVFEIYINSVRVATLKLFQDPTNNKGFFDASPIVRSYIQDYFRPNTTTTAFSYNSNSIYVQYEVRFGEEYSGTTYTNLTNGTYKAYNYYNPSLRLYGTDTLTSFNNKFLTNRDTSNIDADLGQKLFVGWFMGTPANLTMTIQKYNENGTLDGSAFTGATYTPTSFTLLDIGSVGINTYAGSTFITSTTYKYGVKINYPTASNEIMVFLKCSKYDTKTLHFLNSLGGYDTFSFRLITRENKSLEKKSYSKFPFTWNGTSMSQIDSYNKTIGGNINYSVNQTTTFMLNSDWVSETDYSWLKELISSTDVYLENNGQYHSVNIKNTNWSSKNSIIDKMFNLQLEIELSSKTNSQFR